MKPTHKTVYTMDIKRHNVCCWLIGNCRDEPLTQRRKSYNRGKGKTQYKKQTNLQLVLKCANQINI